MADPEQEKIIRRGVTNWSEWRRENDPRGSRVSIADLSGTDLKGCDLAKADLNDANLEKAILKTRTSMMQISATPK